MKRFRFPLLAASALLVLMACSSTDESVKDDLKNAEPLPVNFGTYVNQGVTRAGQPNDITTVGSLASSQGFGVFAYYTDNVEYSGNQIPNFMYNQQVTSSDAGSTWTYSPVKYWPNEYGSSATSDGIDMLSFFAYAPYVIVTASTGQVSGSAVAKSTGITALTRNTATGDPLVKYMVGYDETGGCVDLLWGVNTLGFPIINQTRPTGASSNISFTFKHALAKLSATIMTDATIDANSKVYVRSITITGFASKGTLNLNNVSSNTPLWLSYDGADPTFEGMTFNDGRKDGREGTTDGTQSNEKNQCLNSVIIESAGSGTWPTGKTAGVTNSSQDLFTNSLYIIPSGGSEAVDVTIVYDVETKDTNLSTKLSDGTTSGVSIENRITKTAVFGASSGFVAGKEYTLSLTLGMKDVKFSVNMEPWGTSGGSASPTLP